MIFKWVIIYISVIICAGRHTKASLASDGNSPILEVVDEDWTTSDWKRPVSSKPSSTTCATSEASMNVNFVLEPSISIDYTTSPVTHTLTVTPTLILYVTSILSITTTGYITLTPVYDSVTPNKPSITITQLVPTTTDIVTSTITSTSTIFYWLTNGYTTVTSSSPSTTTLFAPTTSTVVATVWETQVTTGTPTTVTYSGTYTRAKLDISFTSATTTRTEVVLTVLTSHPSPIIPPGGSISVATATEHITISHGSLAAITLEPSYLQPMHTNAHSDLFRVCQCPIGNPLPPDDISDQRGVHLYWRFNHHLQLSFNCRIVPNRLSPVTT